MSSGSDRCSILELEKKYSPKILTEPTGPVWPHHHTWTPHLVRRAHPIWFPWICIWLDPLEQISLISHVHLEMSFSTNISWEALRSLEEKMLSCGTRREWEMKPRGGGGGNSQGSRCVRHALRREDSCVVRHRVHRGCVQLCKDARAFPGHTAGISFLAIQCLLICSSTQPQT